MKEKIDRQILRAVHDVVVRLSRDEVPDNAALAVALASGETTQTLADKAKERIDRRTAKPEEVPVKPPVETPKTPVEQKTPLQPARAQPKK